MPIRPENRGRYPKDWPNISKAAKDAAGWRCACRGECGRGTHEGRCPNHHGQPAYGTGSQVVLTTAHLNHTPEDCRPENLVPMCQGCHLHYDKDHHRQTAAATRRAAVEAAGQLALIPEPARPPKPRPSTYWENRGPRDWQPVTVTCRYGPCGGDPEPPFPLVRTGRLGPRNVAIVREDGTSDVMPVRNLRRKDPTQ